MHKKQNNKESKTHVQGLRLFGNTLPHGVKGILKRNGYNYSEIINKWNMLVGKDISKCCYPVSIKTTKINENGILVIAVKRGNEIEIEYSKNEIINNINSHFGYKFINEIKIKSFNSELKSEKKSIKINFSKNLEKKINEIDSKNIRESLSELVKIAKND